MVVGERRRDYRKAWKTACKAAGVEGTLRHDLRRSAARNLIRAGVPADIAMAYLGHKSRAMLSRYNVTEQQNDHANAAAKLTAYLAASDSVVTNGAVSGPDGDKAPAPVIALQG